MEYDLFQWAQILASFATVIVLGVLIYELKQTRAQNKHAKKLMEYEHAPYLSPFLTWHDKEKKDYRELNIKNIGHGAATNIMFEVTTFVNNEKKNYFKTYRATFMGDSHNTEIPLKENMKIILHATYFDITNREYVVTDEYKWYKDNDERWVFQQTKRDRKTDEHQENDKNE